MIQTQLKTGPVVNFISGNNNIDDDAIVTRNAYFKVVLSATKGTAGQLRTFEVLADGVSLDPTKMKIAGAAAASNPVLLFAPDVDGVSNYVVEILSSNVADTVKYTFKFTDNAGNSDSEVINIFTLGEPVVESIIVRMYNMSGPFGGGVDLINFLNVPSLSTSAHMHDTGKNTSGDWAQIVHAANGSSFRIPPAGFSFDNLTLKSNIDSAYVNGSASPFGNDLEYSKYKEFIVKNGSNYFAVKVVNIVVTATNNEDYAELKIKK
jgi:hypothetical protein